MRKKVNNKEMTKSFQTYVTHFRPMLPFFYTLKTLNQRFNPLVSGVD